MMEMAKMDHEAFPTYVTSIFCVKRKYLKYEKSAALVFCNVNSTY